VAQNVKDGLEGLVRLRKEQLTELQDQQFFERSSSIKVQTLGRATALSS